MLAAHQHWKHGIQRGVLSIAHRRRLLKDVLQDAKSALSFLINASFHPQLFIKLVGLCGVSEKTKTDFPAK